MSDLDKGRFHRALDHGLDAVDSQRKLSVDQVQWHEIDLQQIIRDISNGVESPKALAYVEDEQHPVFIKLLSPKDVVKYLADYEWLDGLDIPLPPWIKPVKFRDQEMYGIMYPDMTEQGKYYYVSYNDKILQDADFRALAEEISPETLGILSAQIYDIMQKISGVHGNSLAELLPDVKWSDDMMRKTNRRSLVQVARNTGLRFKRVLPGIVSFRLNKSDPREVKAVCSDLGEDLLAAEREGQLTQYLYYYFLNCADGASAFYKVFGKYPELPNEIINDPHGKLRRHIFSMV